VTENHKSNLILCPQQEFLSEPAKSARQSVLVLATVFSLANEVLTYLTLNVVLKVQEL
jgi:hypothetical protein